MGILSDFREKHPRYSTLRPEELAATLYQQNPEYQELSFDEFKDAINYDEDVANETGGGEQASLGEIGTAIGSGLSSAVDVFQESVGRATRQATGGIDFEEDSFLDKFIKRNEQEAQANDIEFYRKNKSVLPFTNFLTLDDLKKGLSQLGYSGAAALGGAFAGQAAAPELPVVGAMTGAAALSGVTTALVDRDQFLSQLKEKLSQEDPNWSKERWDEVQKAVGDDATIHGLWEAIPEAVSAALTAGIIKAPLGKIVESIPFIKEGITRTMVSAGAKLGAEVTEELGTEALQQLKESEIEFKHGLRDSPLTSYSDALEEIAPQTLVMSAAMLGFGGALNKMSREGKVKSPKQVEVEKLNLNKQVSADPLDQEVAKFNLDTTEGIDALDRIVSQGSTAQLREQQFAEESLKIETAPLEEAPTGVESRAFQEELRKAEREARIGQAEAATRAYQEQLQVPEPSREVQRLSNLQSLEENRLGRPLTAEESAALFEQEEPTPTMQEAEKVGEERGARKERLTGTQAAFEGLRETFTNKSGEGFATPAAVKAALKKEGKDINGYDIIQAPNKKWIGSPKSIQGLRPEPKMKAEGLDNPDQALSYIEEQIPAEDREQMQDVFKQVRDANLHKSITFPQQLFNMINKTYERRTGKTLDYLTEQSGPAAKMESTPITGEDGRAYILEDLAAGIYKAGQSIAQFIKGLKERLGSVFSQIKDRVSKLYQGVKEFHMALGPERGSIPVAPERKEKGRGKITREDVVNIKTGENLESVKEKIATPDNKESMKRVNKLINALHKNRTDLSEEQIKRVEEEGKRVEDATAYRKINIQEKGADAAAIAKNKLSATKTYSKRFLSKLPLAIGSWTLPQNAILDMMDGFKEGRGFFHELFYNKLDRADTKASEEKQRRKKAITIDKMKKLNISVEDLKGMRETTPGIERQLQDLMYIWLGWNNPQTKKALENMGIKEEEYNTINADLSDSEKELAREIQKDLESKWEQLADVLRKIHGYVVVDGMSQKQVNIFKKAYPNMKTFDRVANYLPMWGDGFETRADGDSLVAELSGQRGTKRAKLGDKFKYERVEESHRPIRLDLMNIWDSAVNMQENFIHLSEPLKLMEKAFNGISDQVEEKYGNEVKQSFYNYFDRIKNPNIYKQNSSLSKVGRFLRKNTALAYLGYNVVTAAKQIPSLLYYLPYTSPSHLLRATAEMMTGKFKETVAFAQADPQMRERMLERSLAELKAANFEEVWGDKLLARFGKKGSKTRNVVINHAMDFIQSMDRIVTSVGYKAVYEYELQRGATPEQARERARLATNNTQPSANAKDIPALYATNEWLNMFLMFSNQLNKIWRMGSVDLVARGIVNREFSKNQMMHGAALAAGAVLISSISHGFRPPKDKEDFAEALFEGTISSLPLIGGPMIKSWMGFPSSETPLTAIPKKTMDAIKNSIDKGGPTEKEWSSFAEALALATGLPFSQPKRMYQAISKGDLKMAIGRKPVSRIEDDVKKLREDIVSWKLKNTEEGKKRELRQMAESIASLERQGEVYLSRKMLNRYFATVRTNKLSTSEANRVLKNARESARKYLSELLTPEEWKKYKGDRGDIDKINSLLHYTSAVNRRYYREQ